ncbi:phosphorylase [Leptospira gomenensis]|uniref:Phosphorylase n=1 Tax=Leptospira gomenensis TaxID=2484974 RepID=A0A5F1Y639_9LEPT|nr:phosphorylase [Leptospira gomenensis]TGK28153.1 phosphorylase [Leptospira gomenensis]TGK36993.1 phosphorylase [Leptospira gomenensis]TGK45629.1 phosphorylase [Leptospira gomenensis]TGK59568.1 phosphorylase [Leptospira gomenensis]
MIFISVALFPEAKPLIQILGLKISRESNVFPVYRNETHILTVSGIGKVFSAASVAFLLAKYEKEISPTSWIFNFGICGAPKESFRTGESYLVNKVTDASTGKNYFPDILFRSDLPESDLITYDKPVFADQISELPNTLVDMEASGFFQTSRKFFTSERIRIVKTVSDHFERIRTTEESNAAEKISETITTSLPNLVSILTVPNPNGQGPELLPKEIETLIFFTKLFRLSETERLQLKDWMLGYKIRTGLSPDRAVEYLKATPIVDPSYETVRTREEGKKGLNALRKFYRS